MPMLQTLAANGTQVNAAASLTTNGLVFNYDFRNAKSWPAAGGSTMTDTSTSGLNATGSTVNTLYLPANTPFTTASTSVLDTDTHSIGFTIQINNTSATWDKIFGFEPSGTDRSPGIWRWPSNRWIHWRYDPTNSGINVGPTGNLTETPTGTEFSTNTWYYVLMTKNGGTATTYLNGINFGTTAVSPTKTAGASTIRIYPAYTQNSSIIGNLHGYNRVLSDNEVMQNFKSFRGFYGI